MNTVCSLTVILAALQTAAVLAATGPGDPTPARAAIRRMAPTWKSNADRPPGGRGLKVGDSAPEFSLRGTTGRRTRLSELRQRGAVVLVFFRGHW